MAESIMQVLQSIARTLLVLGLLAPNYFIERAFADEATLDLLFLKLKYANDEATARVYENEIWQAWFRSDDERANSLMQQAMKKRGNYDFAGAVAVLSTLIDLKPDYAEAWNQRATVYYYQENYAASLEDIAQTLALEPRHFGALSGRAMIRLHQSKPALARQNIMKAVEIHPYLKERNLFPDTGNQ